jgi:asparagine synthase (glutamine-hydrolysing)
VRLSIIDRAFGHQPMQGSYGGCQAVLVYNGEVYNFRELRGQLEASGFNFRTNCDTEVVLAAHLTWGAEAVRRLDGMFAYAIWEPASQRLTLARDRFGIKPLFFRLDGKALCFASEPKALRPTGGFEPNAEAILEYFVQGSAFASGYTTGDRSFFEQVTSVPPACQMIWESGRMITHRYWAPEQEIGEYRPSRDQAREELAGLVHESVESMRMGEVPVGTALSGGLDSSWTTGQLAAIGPPVISSCITFRGDHGDPDASHASLLSEWLNQRRPGSHELHYAYLSAEQYLNGLDTMIRAFDEPHWELRQLGMFANYGMLAELGRTVVLTGEGADELFFGYFQRFPGFRRPALSGPADLHAHWIQRAPWVRGLLRPAFESGRLPGDSIEKVITEAVDKYFVPVWRATGDQLRSMQCWYLQTFLRWLLLVNDRCSMAHSIEGRFPFLSASLVSFALRVPPAWNIAGTGPTDCGGMKEKILMRQAASESLPPAIWRDRDKAPLPVPQMATYHLRIAERLQYELETADNEVWQWLDRDWVLNLVAAFKSRAEASVNLSDRAGEHLTAYIALDEELSVRTAQLFSILTFIRWHTLCL